MSEERLSETVNKCIRQTSGIGLRLEMHVTMCLGGDLTKACMCAVVCIHVSLEDIQILNCNHTVENISLESTYAFFSIQK